MSARWGAGSHSSVRTTSKSPKTNKREENQLTKSRIKYAVDPGGWRLIDILELSGGGSQQHAHVGYKHATALNPSTEQSL
jgi:hypothetical protein